MPVGKTGAVATSTAPPATAAVIGGTEVPERTAGRDEGKGGKAAVECGSAAGDACAPTCPKTTDPEVLGTRGTTGSEGSAGGGRATPAAVATQRGGLTAGVDDGDGDGVTVCSAPIDGAGALDAAQTTRGGSAADGRASLDAPSAVRGAEGVHAATAGGGGTPDRSTGTECTVPPGGKNAPAGGVRADDSGAPAGMAAKVGRDVSNGREVTDEGGTPDGVAGADGGGATAGALDNAAGVTTAGAVVPASGGVGGGTVASTRQRATGDRGITRV